MTRGLTRVRRCDDCQIEQELFKDLVGPPCPHVPGGRHAHRSRRR